MEIVAREIYGGPRIYWVRVYLQTKKICCRMIYMYFQTIDFNFNFHSIQSHNTLAVRIFWLLVVI